MIFTPRPHPPPQPQQSGQQCLGKVSKAQLIHSNTYVRTVQITLAGLGDATASLVLVLLEDANLLQGLHDLAVDGAGGVDVLGGARATVLGGTVDLAETADTNGLAEVDVAGDGGSAHVEPVGVLGGHLLGGTGLDGVNPTWAILAQDFDQRFHVATYQERAACPDASRTQRRR